MNRQLVKELRDALQEALASVEEEHNVKVHVGNASYSNSNATFKVEVADIVEGNVITKEVSDFKKYANLYGLIAEDLGKTVKNFNGEKYKIAGLKPRSKKYPIIMEQVGTGTSYKFSEKVVSALLNL